MVWRASSVVDQRLEFCRLAVLEGSNLSELCRRFLISRQTGHVWLKRFLAGEGLQDRSRRPQSSPGRTEETLEQAVIEVRKDHPAWGARKIARRLLDTGTQPPSPSTVHAILVRHGLVSPEASAHLAPGRFEREAPNLLWQMDFKGQTPLQSGALCHPLTIIDDHSRFAIGLEACPDERLVTVRDRLERIFRRYGLPHAIYADNGNPWGTGVPGQWTRLRVWLLKLGVEIIHARPYHPQGRGKNERFHRSLKAEVLSLAPLASFAHAQRAFDHWRDIYNHHRPHQGIDMAVPASRYQPSRRSFPDQIAEPDYGQDDVIRRIGTTKAYIRYKGRLWRVPKAFQGETIAIRNTQTDGVLNICFGAIPIAKIDLRTNP